MGFDVTIGPDGRHKPAPWPKGVSKVKLIFLVIAIVVLGTISDIVVKNWNFVKRIVKWKK